MMTDPSLGQLLIQALPFVTQALSPELSEALGKFIEEVTAVLTAHAGATQLGAIRKRLLSYARKEIKPPDNHDLQKAFYASFLRATEVMYLARLDQLGFKAPTMSWVTGLVSYALGTLRLSSITTVSLRPKEEKEALLERLEELRSEICSAPHISSTDLEDRLPLRPNVSILNNLTLEAKNRGLGASGRLLVGSLIKESRWYVGLGQPLAAFAEKSLLDCMSAFFAEEIKTKQRVEAILCAEVLAGTTLTLDALVSELRDAKVWLATISEELNSLKEDVRSDFQKVFRVVDVDFMERQKHEPVKSFLGVSRGDWALVAQERAIERDLVREVTEKVLESRDRAILQIIRGEPGSGKTTLLLQIGRRLVASGCIVLEVLPAAPLFEFQYFAPLLSG